ncbi:MAG: hypothetical protein ACI4GC_07605 [Acutalibacteraceae bacterium]
MDKLKFYIAFIEKHRGLILSVCGVISIAALCLFFFNNDKPDVNENTIVSPSYSYNSNSSTQNGVTDNSTAGSSQNISNFSGVTYVMTTSPDKQAPWESTTRFEIGATSSSGVVVTDSNGVTVTNPYNGITIPSTSTALPNVNTQPAQSTTWQKITTTTTQPINNDSQNNVTTKTTTTKKTTTTTKPTTTVKADPIPVDVVTTGTWVDSSGVFYVGIDSDGWGGTIRSNQQSIKVVVDGVAMSKSVPIKIKSNRDADGNQAIELDLTEYEIDLSSASISFVVPEGFLQTVSGSKYNNSFEVTN